MEASILHPPSFRRSPTPESGAKDPQSAPDSSSASSIRQIDARLASSRISLHGKMGCLSEAQDLFDNCNARDRVLWNALISAYTRHSLLEEALQRFATMQDEGVLPNVVTFSSLLKALSNCRNRKPSAAPETEESLFSSRMLRKGEQIHVMSSNKGTLSMGSGNVILNTALVDMYVKFGELVKAQQVFDGIVLRDAIAWNVLMAGYVRYGDWAEAFSCFAHMLEEGLCPDPISFVCVLKACAILASIRKGEKIHVQVLTGNLNVNLGNALLDMYVKCGEVQKAQVVFDELDVHDVVSWNSLIGGYVHHGCSGEALNCLGKMQDEGISPDSVTFTCILKACSSIGLIEEGEKIHDMVKKQGLLENDIVLSTALIDMYAKCGAICKAREVFDSLRARNVVSWNALIVGYVLHGHDEAAMECFSSMQQKGFSPDAITFSCVLKVCGRKGLLEKGEEIHAEIAKRGFLLVGDTELLGSALIDMYAKCGVLNKAQAVFDCLLKPSSCTWTALLSGYASHGCDIEVFDIFLKMQNEGKHLSLDVVTLVCFLKACGSLGSVEKGEEIHKQVIERNLLQEDIVLGTALVSMYAKCGCVTEAQLVFDELSPRDIVLWNALMAGYAQLGQARSVLFLLTQMVREAIIPDVISFLVLLTACTHAGLVAEGERYYNEMNVIYSLTPVLEHHACMVDLWGSAGQLDKAILFIENVSGPNKLRPLSILMGACQKWLNVGLGRWAFEHLLELDGNNVALYVSMSNMYASF